jgi:predicted Rossmann fold nucleotide-binding protein DprA/Smf involved in DNA uptake
MSDHDRELAALLLVNRLSPTPAEPLKASEYWSLLDAVADPSVLLGLDGTAVASAAALDQATGDRVAALFDGATAFAIARERLEESGIRILSSLSASFPERLRKLGTACPACLYVAGRAASLAEGGLGIVGSRDVDEKGAAVASLAAEHAVALGHQVVSGLARGVDQTSMATALQSRGQVVGVPTEGLRRVGRQPDVRQAVLDEHLTLVSPYSPDAAFTAGNAVGRNKLIYALADVTLVVASDEGRGGTWDGAVEALRRGFARVVVWTGPGAGPGNDRLVRKGAAPVDDVEDLFAVATAGERHAASQGILDLGADDASR